MELASFIVEASIVLGIKVVCAVVSTVVLSTLVVPSELICRVLAFFIVEVSIVLGIKVVCAVVSTESISNIQYA